jgi:hypothetical protein
MNARELGIVTHRPLELLIDIDDSRFGTTGKKLAVQSKSFNLNYQWYRGVDLISDDWANLIVWNNIANTWPEHIRAMKPLMNGLKTMLGLDRAMTVYMYVSDMYMSGNHDLQERYYRFFADFRFREDDKESMTVWELFCQQQKDNGMGYFQFRDIEELVDG